MDHTVVRYGGGWFSENIWVNTTSSDADWVVKLIDEYPDRLPGYDKDSQDPDLGGTQQMVRSETLRGRYRNSLSKPEPFEPGKITPVTVELQDVLHTFKPGHRIMVQVQSGWFPLYDRNPQTFVDSIFWAQPEDYKKVTQRIYHAPGKESFIELPMVVPPPGR